MARKPRVHYSGALYHVIARGNNKAYIFRGDDEKKTYLEKVFKYIDKYGGRLYAYVIMDNHCHLLIEAGDTPVSKVMQLIQQTYTSWYNRKTKQSGHVFEQRFKSILCDKDAYLLALVRYIHQNPVRAGIGGLDYMFSSHHLYLSYDTSKCQVAEVLGLFSAKRKRAIQLYQEFVSKTDDVVRDRSDKEMAPECIEIEPELCRMGIAQKDKEEIIEVFEKTHGIGVDMLKGKYLSYELIAYRKMLIREVLKYKVMSQIELSKYFGITESQVSRIYNSAD